MRCGSIEVYPERRDIRNTGEVNLVSPTKMMMYERPQREFTLPWASEVEYPDGENNSDWS